MQESPASARVRHADCRCDEVLKGFPEDLWKGQRCLWSFSFWTWVAWEKVRDAANWNSIVPPGTSLIWPSKHHLLNLSEPPFPSGLSRLSEAQVLNVHSTCRQPSTQAAGMDDLHWDMQWGSRPFGHSHLLLIRAQNKKPTRSQNKV